MTPSARLDATFAALADPTRRAIIARLASGEATVMELAKPFAMSQPAISKHLKVLEQAGLISRSRDAQRRPCRIEAKRLEEANQWLERYSAFWEACPVLQADEPVRTSRLLLVRLVGDVIRQGLDLLGIETIPQM